MTHRNVSPSPTSPILGVTTNKECGFYGCINDLHIDHMMMVLESPNDDCFMMVSLADGYTYHMMISMTGMFSSGLAASPIALAICVPPILKLIQQTQIRRRYLTNTDEAADKQKVLLLPQVHS